MAISQDQAIEILREAFAPLRCGVSASQLFGDEIRMRVVTDDERQIFSIDRIGPDSYGTLEDLQMFIVQLRADAANRGVQLDPWQMPTDVAGAA